MSQAASHTSQVKPNQDLRKFGLTMAVCFGVIGLIVLLRHKHDPLVFFLISGIFLVLAVFTAKSLGPVQNLWMKFGGVLGWINTRIILTIVFYLVLTPIGLIMRLFKPDLLEQKFNDKATYWKTKDSKPLNPQDYERQF